MQGVLRAVVREQAAHPRVDRLHAHRRALELQVHVAQGGRCSRQVELQLCPALELALDRRLVEGKLHVERHPRVGLLGEAAGGKPADDHVAPELALRVIDRKAHVAQLQPTHIESRALAFLGRCIQGRGGVGSVQQVVDVALAQRISRVVQVYAMGLDAFDHESPAQKRQHIDLERNLLDAGEFIGALVLAQAHLRELDLQARKHTQADGPVDHERALLVYAHPVDRQALEAVGVERGDQIGGRENGDEHQGAEGHRRAPDPLAEGLIHKASNCACPPTIVCDESF